MAKRLLAPSASILLLALAACGPVTATSTTPASSAPGTPSAQPSLSRAPVAASSAAQAAPAPAPVASPGLKQVHDPGQVTGTLTGPCHANGQLPDAHCTPGSIDPSVTQANIGQTICVRGYTATIRPPESDTSRFKYDEAYPAYSIPDAARAELDHLVPLELGGSNDASNLWPEQPPTPNPKDEIERAANKAVCSGRMTLAAAQDAMAANWVALGQQLGAN